MSGAPDCCPACGDKPEPFLTVGGRALVRSPGCGLVWQRRFPLPEELAALYGDDYFTRWGVGDDGEGLARVESMKRASYADFLSALSPWRRDGRLLDVGCALGLLVSVALERGFDAYGVDVNPDAIARARREIQGRIRAGLLDGTTYPDLRFDVVTLIDVLEHVPGPAAFLEEIAAHLTPGGLVLAVLPNAASLSARILGRLWPHYVAEHLYHWTPSALRRFAGALGFEVLEIRSGIRKTLDIRYMADCSEATGAWQPPGLSLLPDLRLRIPTGEMLAILRLAPAQRGP